MHDETLTLIDRGGTFTDVVRMDPDGTVSIRKVRSDEAVIGDLVTGRLRFGTTVATNALLERTGVRTLALLDEGLEGLPWIGDMTRPDLFDPDVQRAAPLCERAVGVPGRIGPDGEEIEPLVLPDPSVLKGFEAVAIVRLNGHVDAAHELALADWVSAHAPGVFVALGHQVAPERGLLSRLETTLVHASISPLLHRALARDRIPEGALAIRSDGSLVDAAQLTAPDAVLSGPAGGVLAVREVARRAGFRRAVGLDMGGTSTDVCRVDGEISRRTGRVEVAGVHLARPMLAVDTIAAGGGSILWNDGTRLGVGPRSAGADPGPQCYGRGGPPTLTDAALLLGLVDGRRFDPPLDVSCVDLPGDASSFVDLAREQMAGAVRRLVLSEGADPTDHALVGFGGAAGQHAADVARRLGIRTVLLHPCSAVLSAWGQALAREETARVRDLHVPVDDWERVCGAVAELSEGADPDRVRVDLVLRHAGTDGRVRLPLEADPDAQRSSFQEGHRRRFGYVGEGTIEVAAVHVRILGDEPGIPAEPDWPEVGDGRVIHLPTTSVHVPEGWEVRLADGLLWLEDRSSERPVAPTERTPGGVALWGARFMGVAEAGGAVLQRTARSVNVRERLDFSCAVFDTEGTLVANAPHIPVHLGAMGVTVRSLIAERAPRPGSHWLCNDPAAGGSHLPDLTVVSVGQLGGRPIYVASRAHHVDVGGTTPGSMPPDSTRLSEEGVVFRHLALRADGRGPLLDGVRQPDIVRADLVAQVAANRSMLVGLAELGEPDVVHAWAAHVLDATEELVARRLADLPPRTGPTTDTLDGLPLVLHTEVVTEPEVRLVVDFSGTGGPHPGNLNAPPAVVRSAVLYALRVLLDTDLPLNEGVLRRVRLVLPEPSLLSPPGGAAVAGGNVETSMRVADLLLEALGRCAPSAGTMNNLTLGGEGWSLYETLGGGQGGTNRAPGASARQLHMTNTRATDPEVLEHRVPVRVRRFERRKGSGGPGAMAGGDGLVREIEVLEPCRAALLATRRTEGAGAGLHQGAPGVDAIFQEGVWKPWTGATVELQAGDRVRVETPGGAGRPADPEVAGG